MTTRLHHAELTELIIRALYQVHNELGYGFLESIYEEAMAIALNDVGLMTQREVATPVYFRGRQLGKHRADIIVENKVVLELKTGPFLDPNAEPQLLHYLRATSLEVGLVLHFGRKPAFKRLLWTNDRKVHPCFPSNPRPSSS